MKSLVDQISKTAGEVQVAAEEISSGNGDLSQRTAEQASSLEQTASSMEQMASHVRQTADNAAQANKIPGVDLSKLAPEKRAEALKALNSEHCTCGCGLTLAQCRLDDPNCSVSLPVAVH